MEQYCHQCPRECRVDRDAKGAGYCGMPNEIYVSRCAPHMWEEPPISGTRGSGTLFFTGCNLRCVFCQNAIISRERKGKAVDEKQLKQMISDEIKSKYAYIVEYKIISIKDSIGNSLHISNNFSSVKKFKPRANWSSFK